MALFLRTQAHRPLLASRLLQQERTLPPGLPGLSCLLVLRQHHSLRLQRVWPSVWGATPADQPHSKEHAGEGPGPQGPLAESHMAPAEAAGRAECRCDLRSTSVAVRTVGRAPPSDLQCTRRTEDLHVVHWKDTCAWEIGRKLVPLGPPLPSCGRKCVSAVILA